MVFPNSLDGKLRVYAVFLWKSCLFEFCTYFFAQYSHIFSDFWRKSSFFWNFSKKKKLNIWYWKIFFWKIFFFFVSLENTLNDVFEVSDEKKIFRPKRKNSQKLTFCQIFPTSQKKKFKNNIFLFRKIKNFRTAKNIFWPRKWRDLSCTNYMFFTKNYKFY